MKWQHRYRLACPLARLLIIDIDTSPSGRPLTAPVDKYIGDRTDSSFADDCCPSCYQAIARPAAERAAPANA